MLRKFEIIVYLRVTQYSSVYGKRAQCESDQFTVRSLFIYFLQMVYKYGLI